MPVLSFRKPNQLNDHQVPRRFLSFRLTSSKCESCPRRGGQVWKSETGCYMTNLLSGTLRGLLTLFIYAAIISLQADLFYFASPEQSNKGEFSATQGLSTSFKEV